MATTLPVTKRRSVKPPRQHRPRPLTPAGRRGSWGNLSLDAPTQRNINQFSGFNSERALAGADDDSVKDAFQRWAGGQDFNLKGKTKDQIGDFYEQNLQSAKDYGLDIRDVQGEKILINTKERGPEWIDSVIGAGGDNPMFGWQSRVRQPRQSRTGAERAADERRAEPGARSTRSAAAAGETAAQDQLQAEIDALINGGASPTRCSGTAGAAAGVSHGQRLGRQKLRRGLA